MGESRMSFRNAGEPSGNTCQRSANSMPLAAVTTSLTRTKKLAVVVATGPSGSALW
jgi:hypothetical protein